MIEYCKVRRHKAPSALALSKIMDSVRSAPPRTDGYVPELVKSRFLANDT